jgi:hypothetical protein
MFASKRDETGKFRCSRYDRRLAASKILADQFRDEKIEISNAFLLVFLCWQQSQTAENDVTQ